ncbi:30S ribosomal protein S27ae [Nanoarchaeota archaeon]
MADNKAPEKGKSYKVSGTYEVNDDGLKKKLNCPKCGDGYRMADHKNRRSCGRCKYTEFK